MEENNKLLILYATQTGNAIDAAERIQREAERRCCPVTLLPIDAFDAISYNFNVTINLILFNEFDIMLSYQFS